MRVILPLASSQWFKSDEGNAVFLSSTDIDKICNMPFTAALALVQSAYRVGREQPQEERQPYQVLRHPQNTSQPFLRFKIIRL
jgi:hypothetical protein